ncbi:ABC transporter substrate-binding protein [Corticimicrobacter populi]|uniref:ABC transporter substrate-binding protein n=1 Tax=Corticimicrobacter populi TaxID=2175229 RepID=A0A2V1JYE3_9BURK|nr:ABC transporter substrate-binding protein [Corticimicrobacter populi]PWF21524.1 ABC transporter substrate-binding protein [Corticimicrobacter populi]
MLHLPAELIQKLCPTGVLRAAINVGNPILAHRDKTTGSVSGVSIDLAHELARRLGVEAELSVFDTAAESVEAVSGNQADVGFFAIDPKRGEALLFTAPYVLIKGAYLVRENSPILSMEEVDQPGIRVVVGQGSAYDLHLSRTLAHAQIVRAPSSPAVVDFFLNKGLDVAAGVRQQIEADAVRLGGLRLLDGHFMQIQQAMGTPRSRGEGAAAFVRRFVEDMKKQGFVAEALARHDIRGAEIAPLA